MFRYGEKAPSMPYEKGMTSSSDCGRFDPGCVFPRLVSLRELYDCDVPPPDAGGIWLDCVPPGGPPLYGELVG